MYVLEAGNLRVVRSTLYWGIIRAKDHLAPVVVTGCDAVGIGLELSRNAVGRRRIRVEFE